MLRLAVVVIAAVDLIALGLLLFDDGTTFSLDGEVVVGREPDGDPRVASGDAQPLVVTDTERSVSRLHLRIVLQGGAVELIDLRSANGTAIRRPRDSAWHPLTPGAATTISPDTEVRLGNRTFMFTAQGHSTVRPSHIGWLSDASASDWRQFS